MSGFEENPFGEPTVDNPFADPAIQQVTTNTSNAQRGLEDYNPFADQGDQRPAAVRGASNPPQYQTMPTMPIAQPAIMQPTQEIPPPPYTRTGQQQQQPPQAQQQFSTAEFQRRQEELERKAQELARREEELKNAPYNARRNNWPPLPEKCCFQPCFYQDINVDIPLEFQKIVRLLYYLWMFHACVMALNLLGGLALMFSSADFTTFGLSILYLILFTPFSFLCWYRPAYKAFRSDSSFNFMVFFFVFFFQFVVTVIQTIGIPGSGTCGMLTALKSFDGSAGGITLGIILLIIALCFGAAACMDLLLLSKIHRIYRSTGASFAKAQQEFTTEFLRNEHVQTAATNAAAATIRAQMSSSRY
ncbi:Secretory carrier-associated membrane protein 1 [Cryptotermes secundus]|uniref:Secretory carrier-associated membrane protein n=1 Tax=Cryptotermes secundus TaxID=105785 RepID=A0A2J7RIA9_9NEOP|nr:secretory carrier-associated membrane protein 1 isoform X2 [Cryptotermes secundus]PNF40565.1 Secretory carrier-associated membrane protein 1 [Cryptotermes secundus]